MTPMHLEVMGSLGGSFESTNIVDYYMDPVEIGLWPIHRLQQGTSSAKRRLPKRSRTPKRKER